MHRLKSRLRKLEAQVDTGPSWNDYFARAEQLARSMLAPADRDLVADAIQLRKERGCNVWTEMHRSVWERRSSAFDRAVADLRIPFSMLAGDEWL
jgi:hypothetical protein